MAANIRGGKMERDQMTTAGLLRAKREDIRRIAAAHGACNLRVFGSVARGEDGSDGDVDLLINISPPTSSWFPRRR